MASPKNLATFLLGAAAGVAMFKYLQTEDGEKLVATLKEKAELAKGEAEKVMDNPQDYFEQLKDKSTATLKEQFPDAERIISELLSGKLPQTPAAV